MNNPITRFFGRLFHKNLDTVSSGLVMASQDGRPYRKPIKDIDLVKRNVGWAYACADINANSCGEVDLRLFSTKPTATSRSRFASRTVAPWRLKYIESKNDRRMQLKIHQAAGVEELLEHPLLSLLSNVNTFMTEQQLRYLTVLSLEVTGNAYWLKIRDTLGVPTEIWPLLPQFVRPIADKSNLIKHFEFGTRNQKVIIPNEDMVFFRYPSLSSPVLGASPLEKGIMSIDLSIGYDTFELGLLQRGGTPDVVISFPENVQLEPDQRKRLEREFASRYGGLRNVGKLVILGGGAKIDKFSFSPKEMNYLKGRRMTLEQIAGVFGVPIAYLITQEISRANLDGSDVIYKRKTIKPKITMIEQVINEQLTPDFDDNIFVSFDNPVPEDTKLELDKQKQWLETGMTTINEQRVLDGLEEVEWGNEPIISTNVAPLSQRGQAFVPGQLSVKAKADFPALEIPSANYENEEFIKQLAAYFRDQEKAIIVQADDEVFKIYIKASADDLVSAWFDMSLWDRRLTNIVTPFTRATILIGGARALEAMEVTREFDSTDPGILNAMGKRNMAIRGINRTTQKQVREAISTGLEAGEAGSAIRKRINGVYDFASLTRAKNIARTETIWAFNEGAVQGYRQSGVVIGKEWLTAEDERVCEWCGPMDGKVELLDNDFWKMGDEFEGRDGGVLRFQTENIGHAPLHPQCRCSIAPITG